MAGAVAGVIILSSVLADRVFFALCHNDNIMLSIATISTPVAKNSAPDISLVSSLELRRLINM
jgi:hypothetical protein